MLVEVNRSLNWCRQVEVWCRFECQVRSLHILLFFDSFFLINPIFFFKI